MGDSEYALKNNMGIFNIFLSSYSQLITTNINGEKSIIYDVSSDQFSNMIVAFVVIIVFIGVAVAVIVWQFVKLKHST